MKCRYSNCKLGGEVKKDEAIYIDKKYYHEECYIKQINKADSRKIMSEDLKFMTKQVNMILKKLIDDKQIDSNYVLWMIKKIKRDDLTLNTPFGLEHYLSNGHNYNKFKKEQIELEYKLLKNKKVDIEVEQDTNISKKIKEASYGNIFTFKTRR